MVNKLNGANFVFTHYIKNKSLVLRTKLDIISVTKKTYILICRISPRLVIRSVRRGTIFHCVGTAKKNILFFV